MIGILQMQENNSIQVEIPQDCEYFASISDDIWKLLKRYHNVLLVREAFVKSDPVFLHSKKTGNSFAKFTIELESPIPWEKKRQMKQEERGDVYIDTFAFENKKNSPGGFILKNIRKGCLISGIAVLRSGKKPVKHESDQYRANWVYGDYVYINIRDVKIDREAPEYRKSSPYKGDDKVLPYYRDYSDYYNVSDEDIRFDL